MTLDGLSLFNIVKELQEKITNAKIQKVFMPEKEELVLQLYSASEGNMRLAISANAGESALYLSNTAKTNPKTPPTFCMFLRKHLIGAQIESIEQSGLDRVVVFTLSARDELFHPVTLRLVAEVMGRYSNIILVGEDGLIMDSLKRITPDISRMRTVLAGEKYEEPPQQKANPMSRDLDKISKLLQTEEDTRLVPHMISIFDGISSRTGDEILHRAGVDKKRVPEVTSSLAMSLAQAMKQLFAEVMETPQACLQYNNEQLPVFYSCTPFETYPEISRKVFDSCNEMLDYYYTRRAEIFRLRQQKESLEKRIQRLVDRVERRINQYQTSLENTKKTEEYQKQADLIIANLYQLERGMTAFEAMDYETGETVTLTLDPSMTPSKQAQKLYKKVTRFKKSKQQNTRRLTNAFDEQEFLLGALHYAETAQNSEDLSEVRDSLAEAGYLPRPRRQRRKKQKKSKPLKYTSPSGFDIFVGRNDRQNDELTMRRAQRDDIWFHAQQIPGSHVLLVAQGKALEEIDDETIEYAATLAAQHSRARQSGKTPVDYTQRKHVRKPTGARPGKVIYDNHFTIFVNPTNAK